MSSVRDSSIFNWNCSIPLLKRSNSIERKQIPATIFIINICQRTWPAQAKFYLFKNVYAYLFELFCK